jgi:hypothetical protein
MVPLHDRAGSTSITCRRLTVNLPGRRSRATRSGSLALLGLSLIVVSGCPDGTSPEVGDSRLAFMNTGRCVLTFEFSGGVAGPTASTLHTPGPGVLNDVPIEGPGSVTIRPIGAPSGSAHVCNYMVSVSPGARYGLGETGGSAGWCEFNGHVQFNAAGPPGAGPPVTSTATFHVARRGRPC